MGDNYLKQMTTKMPQPFSIQTIQQTLNLKAGNYSIYILGGWGVKLGDFTISLKNITTQETIKPRRVFWPLQTMIFNTRAKRILSIDILESGHYTIHFKNPESLKVTRSNLFLYSYFEQPMPNETITVYFK